ncbi:hypothetical protein NEOLEDRAFT_1143312 [Neolentinus lepideus HHB14362 ss-1]|uniref:Uncharacterized protein n=1 Tax=Neolentinus lepideus HHB14362 ss-1 TaxID=1314782 RepID=A0A165MLI8_9AGAM|nr:hypothetical protein NEOLEDRAFT_1143312 [Neolentinus lepideus HHB14362 ss-1]
MRALLPKGCPTEIADIATSIERPDTSPYLTISVLVCAYSLPQLNTSPMFTRLDVRLPAYSSRRLYLA